ncbi:MAG: hypothetical protein IKA46_05325 [Clostridia bacterium]|nr:hypothetical protein [Clostridia bacterium]
MKKQTRLILFLFLVVLMLVVTAVAASATVHEVGTQAELQNAIGSVVDGDTVMVTASIELSEDLILNVDRSYTLCGSSGVTVTFTAGGLVIEAGEVTLRDISITALQTTAVMVKYQNTELTVESGTTISSSGSASRSGLAIGVQGFATLNVNAGTFYGAVGAAGSAYLEGSYIYINGGTFYKNASAAEEYLFYANRGSTYLEINGGNFILDNRDDSSKSFAVVYGNSGSAAVKITGGTFSCHVDTIIDMRSGALTVTGGNFIGSADIVNQKLVTAKTIVIEGGSFTVVSDGGAAVYLDSVQDTLIVEGGIFDIQNKGVALFADSGASLTVEGGTFHVANAGRVLTVKCAIPVSITNGIFTGVTDASNALFYACAGNISVSGGTFTTQGNALFDVALRKDKGDHFEITGGTFKIEESTGISGGVLLRTSVGVDVDELNADNYEDPTKMYFLCDVDILLSGGVFINESVGVSPLVDVSVGNSEVVITDAVLLSRYIKTYVIDRNDAIGEDVPFVQNTVTVQYNGLNYYCYQAYEENADTTYSPVMVDGAFVTIVDSQPGILFKSTIPGSVVDALTQMGYVYGEDYTFGTLIAPAEYVAAAGGFTHAALNGWNASANIEIPYVDISASESIVQDPESRSISFNGGLINLSSCERAYAAVSYVLVDGMYYYSTYDVAKNAHTMASVAKKAYTSTVESGYPSLYKAGAYSAYTTQEQEILRQYSSYTHTLSTTTGVIPATAVSFDGTVGTNLQNKATSLVQALENYGYGSTGMPILVGSTGNTVKQALAEVEGCGYYIGVVGENIVIAGSNEALAMCALNVFEEICKVANGAAFDLTEIVASNVEMTILNLETPIVYPRTRDMRAYNIFLSLYSITGEHYADQGFNSSGNHLYNNDANNDNIGLDYPLYAAMEIGAALMGGGFNAGFNFAYVPDSFAMNGGAIHVGLTDLARELLLAGEKDVGYYGYFIKDGNLVITSYDDTTLRLAKSLFLADLGDYALDLNGDAAIDVYAIPAEYEFERGNSNGFTGAFDSVEGATGASNVAEDVGQFITAYPRPDDLALSGAVNVSNGELQLYYLDAVFADYYFYCKKLQQNGYTVYMEQRFVEGSYFVTYVNRTANNGEGIMLHVMYHAYKHAFKQELSEDTKLGEMFRPTLRVISSRITDSVSYINHILPENFLAKQSYKKVTDSKLTVVQLGSAGCYVYTLEDGSFVVVDGGNGTSAEVTNFANVLKALYKGIYGKNPTEAAPIRISAWYLTHGHADHVGLLNAVSKKSYFGSTLVVDAIIGNFPSSEESYNAHSINLNIQNRLGTENWFKGTSNGVNDPVPFYNVHTGQKFFVGNLEFEVMFTPEDMHPWSMKAFNNACAVVRLTVHSHDVENGKNVGRNTVVASKVSAMSLGDIYARTARALRATYGAYLESDIMMIAHHGTGGEGELYQLINAQIILWQNTSAAAQSKTKNSSTDRITLENLEMIKNTRWRYILTSRALSLASGEGYNPTMTFTEDGIAGLGEASTAAEVLSEANAFLAGLTNVAKTSAISYGTGYFVGYDFSTNQSATKYTGSGYLLWRGNYFSDTTLPEEPEIEESPYLGEDLAIDIFGDEILLPEITLAG